MTRIPVPRNGDILESPSNAFGRMWFRFFSSAADRLNAVEAVTTLEDDGDSTASGTYQQSELQAVMDKVTELQNSLK